MASRYFIRHLIDGDNVLCWPRELRKGPPVVIASEHDAEIAALSTAIDAAIQERDEAYARVDVLREALRELTALVRGECPSLLDEDSGGDARLALEIDALLSPVQEKQK
jgi:hypothetical protein